MVVLSRANTAMNAHPLAPVPTRNLRCVPFAMARMNSPDMVNLTPANSILLPVWSGVMPNSVRPSLMSGYAQPHANAAVKANTATHSGRCQMLVLFKAVWLLILRCREKQIPQRQSVAKMPRNDSSAVARL